MQVVAGIQLVDAGSGDEGWVFVRAGDGPVALDLSLRGDGDLELAFDREVCARVVRALERAIAVLGEDEAR
jgi:hypothetical protein